MSNNRVFQVAQKKHLHASIDQPALPTKQSILEPLIDQFVVKKLDQLELPCRYSVVYELTRIECLLQLPMSREEMEAEPLFSLWSIPA